MGNYFSKQKAPLGFFLKINASHYILPMPQHFTVRNSKDRTSSTSSSPDHNKFHFLGSYVLRHFQILTFSVITKTLMR